MDLLFLFLDVFQQHYLLIIAFFFIAVLYSLVGFGGGSSYLAILSLSGIAFVEIRAISLLCNITVVFGSTYLYIKNKLFDWKKIFPLVVLSIPMAFLGGYVKIAAHFFYIFLGIVLLAISVLILISHFREKEASVVQTSTLKNAIYGGIVGFVSGMVGLGGGIFLAPLLHLTKWDSPKKIAAASSFFILVNSLAGLFGQMQQPDFKINSKLVILLLIVVFIGGQIGSRLSIKILKPQTIKLFTAVLVTFVGIKILLVNL